METHEQMSLALAGPVDEVEGAFADGRLSLVVKDHARYDSRAWGSHVGAGVRTTFSGPFSTVHIISRPAGGEIRGYVCIDQCLYLRFPVVPWPELDVAVGARLACEVMAADTSR